MFPSRIRQQRQLFEEARAVPIVQLSPTVQEQLRQALTQWMLALASAMREEADDE